MCAFQIIVKIVAPFRYSYVTDLSQYFPGTVRTCHGWEGARGNKERALAPCQLLTDDAFLGQQHRKLRSIPYEKIEYQTLMQATEKVFTIYIMSNTKSINIHELH
jgi:hypothetical protein